MGPWGPVFVPVGASKQVAIEPPLASVLRYLVVTPVFREFLDTEQLRTFLRDLWVAGTLQLAKV